MMAQLHPLVVAMVVGGGSNFIERWVQEVAELSGQPVDWHFCGGRAMVLALGDLGKVSEALDTLIPEYHKRYKALMLEEYPDGLGQNFCPYVRYI